ncbi:MAG: FRG domain-containing protein [Prevotellaceae bacterium]|nr:FRG domain-containing protein [Candidatus Faecinaster equi]
MMNLYEINVSDWTDLFRINQEFLSQFVFRGQGDPVWDLETSLIRMVDAYHNKTYDSAKPLEYEVNMLKDFKWRYPSYQLNQNMVPRQNDDIEWLSLMQHYGAKTRLLDFSYSLYVALYMALYGDFGKDLVVWAININMLQRQHISDFQKQYEKIPSEEELNDAIYNNALLALQKGTTENQIYIINPKICNERISRQQGVFLMPSTITKRFNEVLKGYVLTESPLSVKKEHIEDISKSQDAGVIKFIIPNDMRYELSSALRQMNISAETMFPGLEGLARSVNKLRKDD